MSRHQYVRNMDIHAELDDYDPDYDDEDEEMTEEQRREMRDGLRRTREVLGSDIPGLTDKVIEDALWNYYFDVPQTVNYILKKYTKPEQKKKPKAKGSAVGQGLLGFGMQTSWPAMSPVEMGYFADAPWGNIPDDRKGELVLEGPQLRGGLLGGSSSAPKSSKLAALAKKRKEKAQASTATGATTMTGEEKTSISLLSRLSHKQLPAAAQPESPSSPPPSSQSPPETTPALSVPLQAVPKEQSIVDLVGLDQPRERESVVSDATASEQLVQQKPLRASPSSFAQSIFGERITLRHEISVANARLFFISGNKEAGKPNPFAGPSPDDIVVAAQSASKGLNKGSTQKTPDATVQKTEEAIKAMSLQAPPPLKKVEKIDVLKAYSESNAKENINFVVVGHVDAGKSTLMGRMLYDCGAVDERAMRRYRQESEQIGKGSFALAWVMDQTEEERTRGVTIDIATNHFETPNASFTILDAPGHRDFIPNMIAGASQADFAVLVIDASTGAFEAGFHRQGQTKEHTLLCRSIGVQRIVVAVNKLDAVDWSEARFEEIVQQMQQFLTNAGYSMKNVTFVPMSGLTGINVARKPEEGAIPWYHGPTLLEVLETSNKHTRAVDKPLRLVISDVFRGGITNPVSISGRIDTGYLQEGDVLVSIPSKEQAIVKGVVCNDEAAKWAVAGHNVTVHLSGIDPIHLRPGDVLCNPTSPLVPIKTFNVKLLAFEGMTPMAVDVHKGRLHAAGKVSALLQTIDKSNGEIIKKKPRHIPAGSLARVTVELVGEPIPVESGNRIVLRSSGTTVAAGIIE